MEPMKPEEHRELKRLLFKMRAQIEDWVKPENECDCQAWFGEIQGKCEEAVRAVMSLSYMFEEENMKRWAQAEPPKANKVKTLDMNGRQVKVSYLEKPLECDDCRQPARMRLTEANGDSWNWCGVCHIGE